MSPVPRVRRLCREFWVVDGCRPELLTFGTVDLSGQMVPACGAALGMGACPAAPLNPAVSPPPHGGLRALLTVARMSRLGVPGVLRARLQVTVTETSWRRGDTRPVGRMSLAVSPGGHARPLPALCSLFQLRLWGNEIKFQIYMSYAMRLMAVSTAARRMRKAPNASVRYAVAQCGNPRGPTISAGAGWEGDVGAPGRTARWSETGRDPASWALPPSASPRSAQMHLCGVKGSRGFWVSREPPVGDTQRKPFHGA